MDKWIMWLVVVAALSFPLASATARTVARDSDGAVGCFDDGREQKVRATLGLMKAKYPEARYRDVYKNFMQDHYGPGHILSDTVAAKRYLERELEDADRFEGDLYEPTGCNGNYYRVNLSLIKAGTMGCDEYFSAFVRGVSGIVPPTIEWWREEWKFIDGVVRKYGFHYEEEEADRTMISAQLEAGDPVVHHSAEFNKAYSLHYRIFSRDIFEKEILPLLEFQRDCKSSTN